MDGLGVQQAAMVEPEGAHVGRVFRRLVSKYDGQLLCVAPHGEAVYEIGNYLGGGAAGVVYEAERLSTHERVAVKIINPTSFCLMPSTALQRCVVACRGLPMDTSSPGKVGGCQWPSSQPALVCGKSE
jgi:hypothetical protein